MIKVLCQTMTSSYDSSSKNKVMEFKDLESFKNEVLRHYPKISISLPEENKEFWFGVQYGSTSDGFWFRWLYAIVDTERGCLYSLGDRICYSELGLPMGKQHCAKEVYTMLKELETEVCRRKSEVTFVS